MNQKKQKQEQLSHYLEKNVKPIFDRLLVEILAALPDDVVTWSVDWLQEKGRKIQFLHKNASIQDLQHAYDSEEDENDEEDIADLPQKVKKGKKNTKIRNGVSAEVYGLYHKKEDFKARVIEKSQEQIQKIRDKLQFSFLFEALDERDLKIVIDAMEIKEYKADDWVIKQGDDGAELFVLDSGQLDCYKQFEKDGDQVFLKSYQPGDSFGELALLYNAPRSASIQAKSDTICYALDRDTFNHIVKDAAIKKREHFETTLTKIDLLQSMDPYERTQLCDGVKEQKVKAGEVVIKEGEAGDIFYMISEGELTATIKDDVVYEYKSGDYFGELALLNKAPRSATVTAKSDAVLMWIDFNCFQRLLGPLEEILKRNAEKYSKYMKQE